MDKVKETCLDNVTIETIQNILPNGHRQLLLADAVLGPQPPSTFIVGIIQEAYEKVTVKGLFKKRLVLKEVLGDSTVGNQVSVTFYKAHAEALDTILKKHSSSKKLWLVLSDVIIAKYMGVGTDGWCPFSLGVGHGESNSLVSVLSEKSQPASSLETNNNNAIKILTASTKTKTPQERVFTPLSRCVAITGKYNVFAVVNELVSSPTGTRNNNLHMMVGIADPSSPLKKDDGTINDTLLQLFGSNNTDVQNVLNKIGRGDVVRIREMRIIEYRGGLRGQMYDARQLVLFCREEDPDVYHTVCETYIQTDQEKEKVRSLHKWAAENVLNRPSVSEENHQPKSPTAAAIAKNKCPRRPMMDPLLYDITLSEITEERQFNLSCQVLEKDTYHSSSNAKVMILRVRDGTISQLSFKKYNFKENSCESPFYELPGCDTVDVIVTANVETNEDFEMGGYVVLRNVSCELAEMPIQPGEDRTIYMLSLRNENSVITKLRHHQTLKILRRQIDKLMEGVEPSPENTEDSLIGELAGTIKNAYPSKFLGSPQRKSPNKINCQPLSPNRPNRNYAAAASPRTVQVSSRPSIQAQQTPKPARESHNFSTPKLNSQPDSFERALENLEHLGPETSSTPNNREVQNEANTEGQKEAAMGTQDEAHTETQDGDRGSRVGRNEFPPGLPTSTQYSPSRNNREESQSQSANSSEKVALQDLSPISSSLLPSVSNINRKIHPGTITSEQDAESIASKSTSSSTTDTDSSASCIPSSQSPLRNKQNQVLEKSVRPLPSLPRRKLHEMTTDDSFIPPLLGGTAQSALRAKRKIQDTDDSELTEGPLKVARIREGMESNILNIDEGELRGTGEFSLSAARLQEGSDATKEGTSNENKSPGKKQKAQSGNRTLENTPRLPTEVFGGNVYSVIRDLAIVDEELPNSPSSHTTIDIVSSEETHVTATSSEGSSAPQTDTSNENQSACRGEKTQLRNRTSENIPRLTTEFSGEGVYSALRDLVNINEEITYRVPALVSSLLASSEKQCAATMCLQGICCHDWTWGLCFNCGTNLGSWQLREQYSTADLLKSRLPCNVCAIQKLSSDLQDVKNEASESPVKIQRRSTRNMGSPVKCNQSPPKIPAVRVSPRKRNAVEARKNESPKEDKVSASPSKVSKMSLRKDGTVAMPSSENCKEARHPNANIPAAKTPPRKRNEIDNSSTENSEATRHSDSTQTKAETNSLVPYIRLQFILKDSKDDANIMVYLSGDEAKLFFGVNPTFEWVAGKSDQHISSLVSSLIQSPLWFEIQKRKLYGTNDYEYILKNTKLISLGT